MITITFWPRAARAGTVNLDLNHSSRFEDRCAARHLLPLHSDTQTAARRDVGRRMRPSHLREVQLKKGNAP